MTEQDKIIKGPSYAQYMVGDPGDGITRKILLFGVGFIRYPTPETKESITFTQFVRSVADRFFPEVIDLFLQVPFQSEYYDEPRLSSMSSSNQKDFFSDNYLGDAHNDFRMSLMQNKSFCKELMRVHYTDVSFNAKFKTSPFIIRTLLSCLIEKTKDKISDWIHAEWPSSKNITSTIEQFIYHSRLSPNKIAALEEKVRSKFIISILGPITVALRVFLEDKSNKDTFYKYKTICLQILVGDVEFSDTLSEEVRIFTSKLVQIGDSMTNAYTTMRMLKRCTKESGARWEIALQKGEPMTHIFSYCYMHTILELGNNLKLMGIKLVAYSRFDSKNIQSSLEYYSLTDVINNFCNDDKKQKKNKKKHKKKKVSLIPIETFATSTQSA